MIAIRDSTIVLLEIEMSLFLFSVKMYCRH